MAEPVVYFRVECIDRAKCTRVAELPRYGVTEDGEHRFLVVGNDRILAMVPYDAPDHELWSYARACVAQRQTLLMMPGPRAECLED